MQLSKKLTTFLYLLTILFVFTTLPLEANAGIFDPVSSDKSVEYLTMIFGNKIGNLSLNQQINSNQFLSNLFQIFNGFILTVAIFILSYVSIISTINTAQEGQVMGKKWSSVWIPLRSAIGLLLLAPVPGSGYSSLQVIIMWVVLNGIGAANTIWDFVINNLSQGITATQTSEINRKNMTDLSKQGTTLAKDLFNSLVCVEIINNKIPLNYPDRDTKLLQYYYDPPAKPIQEPIVITFGIKDDVNNKNLCGAIKITSSLSDEDVIGPNDSPITLTDADKENIIDRAYHIKLATIDRMITYIKPIAQQIADVTYQLNGSSTMLPHHINQPGILYAPVKEYQLAMSGLNKQTAMGWVGIPMLIDKQSISDTIINQGKSFGWLTAGSYYYLLSQGSLKNLLTTATEEIIVTESLLTYSDEALLTQKLTHAAIDVTAAAINPYKKALADNHKAISNLFKPTTELAITDSLYKKSNKHDDKEIKFIPTNLRNKIDTLLNNPEYNKVKDSFKNFLNLNETTLEGMQEYLFNNHDDPLLSQAIFGVKLMETSESFWIGIIMSSMVSNALAHQFMGTPTQDVLSTIITLLPPILVFGGIIWTIGASFAIYMPMVPYMMFIVTALGWFLLVIEAIVAAPIVALGFISPSQDELGKVAPALGIIANVFLRPVLMVIGLIIAAKLYSTVINMVNMGFKFSFATLQSQTGTTMFAWIVMLILYSGFIVTLVNKCYGLIYQLPDKILRWIGISGEQTDISSIKETQQSFDQGTKQGIAPVEGMATAGASKLKEHIEAAKKDGSGLR